MNVIEELEKEQLRDDIPDFKPGDTVRLSVRVVEGGKESIRETFTVRRVSYGVGVERTFPVHSPRLAKIQVMRRGKVRRAKLYYLRNLTGKAARIKDIR